MDVIVNNYVINIPKNSSDITVNEYISRYDGTKYYILEYFTDKFIQLVIYE